MNSPSFHKEGNRYVVDEKYLYYSPRYRKWIVLRPGDSSDGASGPAEDIVSAAWWLHDKLTKDKKWADGTPCTNWQASNVARDVLILEKRYFRAHTWFVATLCYGIFTWSKS